MNRLRMHLLVAVLAVAGVASAASDGGNYYVYVAAESEDTVHLLRYGPDGFDIVDTITVGAFATEIEGPHGIRVSPDGRHWYVSIAHGQPYGSVFKYDTADNISVGDTQAGLFPATRRPQRRGPGRIRQERGRLPPRARPAGGLPGPDRG